MFENMDLNNLWDEKNEAYTAEPFSEDMLRNIENELGYKLPESYIYLMRVRNGGRPKNCRVGKWCYEIRQIFGIGKEMSNRYGFYTEDAGYPKIGVPICDSFDDGPMVFLDYRECGNEGEPKVVKVDVEMNSIEVLAKDFESFIKMLSPEKEDYSDAYLGHYKGVQFLPVEGAQRKQLYRAIWGAFLYVLGFTVLILLISCFVLQLAAEGTILSKIGFLIFGVTLLICLLFELPYAISCFLAMKTHYQSYVDTVEAVWECEPIRKPQSVKNKKEMFCCLTKSGAERYPNSDDLKVGDSVRVFRSEKGKILLVRE